MTSITQHIPNLIGGINIQPDELKSLGQVSDAVNVVPDVVKGLIKRPGGWLVNSLTDKFEGKWFNIYQTEDEQYIGNISLDGVVRIWDTQRGLPKTVLYSTTPYNVDPTETPEEPIRTTPGFPDCDVDAFNRALNDYVYYTNIRKELEQDVADLQRQLDEATTPTGYRTEYEVEAVSTSSYKVITGYIQKGGEDIEVNKPAQAKRGSLRLENVVISNYGVRGNVYDWKVPVFSGVNPAPIETALNAKKSELEAAKNKELEARGVYWPIASSCGIYTSPTTAYTLSPKADVEPPEGGEVEEPVDVVISSNSGVLSYLRHSNPEDVQVMSIQDYTFITNRNVAVTMSESLADIRPYEAYIELSQIAYEKQYAIDIGSLTAPEDTVVETRATKVSVENSEWRDDDGSCKFTDTETFDVDGSYLVGDYTVGERAARQNLRFELETRGQQIPNDYKDATKGYECRYRTTARLIFGGEGWAADDIVRVKMSGKVYDVAITEISTTETNASLAAIRPAATGSTGVLTADSILSDLVTEFNSVAPWMTTQKIGNGLYITSGVPFVISTPESNLMSITTSTVTNVSRLPQQCKDGYIVKVENTYEREDDYWLEFKAEYKARKSDGTPIDGVGYWQEVAAPGLKHQFNRSSMPHQIVKLQKDDGTIYFLVTPVDWESRLVGDNTTNPKPSFVGRSITKMLFFRNRFAMLSGDSIVLSQPGEYFNFWAKSAQVISPADSIDISVGSTNPTTLYDGVEVNAGLLLFSAENQFLLTTDQDVFGPETAKINTMASYRFNQKTTPVTIGTTAGFVTSVPESSRYYEILTPQRFTDSDIVDISIPITGLMPNSINSVAASAQNSIVTFGTACENTYDSGSDELFVYKFYNNGERREQSAWVKWQLSGKLVFQTIMGDSYYAVIVDKSDAIQNRGKDIVSLQRFNLRDSFWYTLDDNDIKYNIHMDNFRVILSSEMAYDEVTNTTKFKLPFGYHSDKTLVAYVLSSLNKEYYSVAGRAAYPTIEEITGESAEDDLIGDNVYCILQGDWSTADLMLGYEYEMRVDVPTFYVRAESGGKLRSDTRSSLVIHRVNISLGKNGYYETTLDRVGKSPYTNYYESRTMDGYVANTPAVDEVDQQVVPVYERNTNVKLSISSSHPTPTTIHSITWEGDYNTKNYRRA